LYNLQEAGVFSPHPLPLPDHPALRQLLGFYPLIETIAAQVAFLLLLTITYLYYRHTITKKAGASEQPASKSKRVVA
jgi:high-affinity Fe2+/Pb2+ permease